MLWLLDVVSLQMTDLKDMTGNGVQSFQFWTMCQDSREQNLHNERRGHPRRQGFLRCISNAMLMRRWSSRRLP